MNSLTTPVSVSRLDWSNRAAEWCAYADELSASAKASMTAIALSNLPECVLIEISSWRGSFHETHALLANVFLKPISGQLDECQTSTPGPGKCLWVIKS